MIFYLEDKTREELEKMLKACVKAKASLIGEDVRKELRSRDHVEHWRS